MANSKMTHKDYFNAIKAYLNGEDTDVSVEDMVTFVEGRIEVLNNKSKNRKPTKAQEENARYVEIIKGIVTNEGQTIAEIKAQSDELADFTSQKMAPLLRMAGAVSYKDKKVTYFRFPDAE